MKIVKNIIVLFAGTTDPLCTTSNTNRRSISYESGDKSYWNDHPIFVEKLNGLCNEYDNVALFDRHGWSGYNTEATRKIAGTYLADRLCGGNKEEAYYQAYLKDSYKVAFHLIGHSHGGNLINEFTKRAAVAEEWPDHWKINSITYLSTPFFKKMHQLDTGAFSSDCKIINVVNDFDLTQRIIADFSMYELFPAFELVEKEKGELETIVKKIKDIPLNQMVDELKIVFGYPDNINKFKFKFKFKLIFNSSSFKFNNTDGKRIYNEINDLISQVEKMLEIVGRIVKKLSETPYYASNEIVQSNRSIKEKYFIEEPLKDRMNNLLKSLINDSKKISTAINKRIDKNDYSITPLLGEICPILLRVIDFLTIDQNSEKTTDKNRLIDLFYDFTINQIEIFDSTSTTPEEQLGEFKSQLESINISDKDTYYNTSERKEVFKDFIERLEKAEEAYDDTKKYPTEKKINLLKLCITLLTPELLLSDFTENLRKVKSNLDKLGRTGTFFGKLKYRGVQLFTARGDLTPIRKVAVRLQDLLTSYGELLRKYETKKHPTATVSLKDSCKGSHSTSRKDLHFDIRPYLKNPVKSHQKE